MNIIPTVGRVVWFHPHTHQAVGRIEGQPFAALIAGVQAPDLVNLAYFDANGVAGAARSVPLIQGEAPRPVGFFCEFMPYQKGQAAKTEALEKQLADPK